jgi:hypothetical protein
MKLPRNTETAASKPLSPGKSPFSKQKFKGTVCGVYLPVKPVRIQEFPENFNLQIFNSGPPYTASSDNLSKTYATKYTTG